VRVFDFLTLLVIGTVLGLLLVIAWFSPRSAGFRRFVGTVFLGLTLWFIAYPLFSTLYFLTTDDGLRGAHPSKFAFALHRSLSRRLPTYIDERIESKVATTLSIHQITATESPVYGAFFFLQASERLQQQWQKNPRLARSSPAQSGKQAIDASLRILLDPLHAHWVRTYWGDDYLDDPNCFYRMLLVGGITSHHHLTGKTEHLPLLKRLVDDLIADLDASPSGLVDDYPDQCFPCDVACCLAIIAHSSDALGEDHREWAQRAFARMMLHYPDGLVPYMADSTTGSPTAATRGCTNGFFFTYTPELAPETSADWYRRYVDEFWQDSALASGWREYPKSSGAASFGYDPDSGPVAFGFGTGATGLGLGCTRVHGDHRKAGILGAEMMASSYPLPGGSLLVPQLVSDREHAPYFAEIAVLHQLSLLPHGEFDSRAERAPLRPVVFGILALEAGALVLLLLICRRLLGKVGR
jgi:hypothetical protein